MIATGFQRPWILLLLLVPALFVMYRTLRRTGNWRTWLRGIEVALLLLAIAGPIATQRTTTATAIFVLDASASVQPASADAASRWITGSVATAGIDANSAIIRFGAEPDLIVPPSPASALSPEWTGSGMDPANASATSIGSALDLALALPVGEQRRIVLLSDGANNAGDVNEVLERARQHGVPIDVVTLNGIDANDLRIAQVTGPSAVWQGEPVSLLVSVGSGTAGTANLTVTIDGEIASQQTVSLTPGTTSLTVSAPALSPGFHAVEIEVSGNPDFDTTVENNRAPFAVVVRDRPQVLVIAPVGADPDRFVSALTTQGALVDQRVPADVPSELAQLSQWDAIVLDNVPSWDLSTRQQQALIDHTRSGRGLIVIGGSASYGPGSYAGTPLAAALPVSVKVTDGRQRPKVAVMIVMDKSGSMSYDPNANGTSKLSLAKDGVITAASALSSGDEIGVIAFNDKPIWALPMTRIGGASVLDQINQVIAPLKPDGGTEIYPALQLAYDSLRNTDADVRHIILLSDGKSRSGTTAAFEELIADASKDNVTLSAVALGTDADIALLQAMASQGRGRYHFATTPDQIPRITFQEARSAGSQSVLRGAFQPVQQQPSPILNGIDVTTLPSIDGYNFAQGRPGAQVDLVSDRRDPLLAKWQLGLGRVIAWTADDGSDFASAWNAWPDYDLFWGNALRWSLPDPNDGYVTVSSYQEGLDTVISFDTRQSDGSTIRLTETTASITQPDGSVIERPLTAAGTGIWRARLVAPAPGAYQVTMQAGEVAATRSGGMISAVVVPPSQELQPSTSGTGLMQQIATITSGSVRSLDDVAGIDLFAGNGNSGSAPGTIRQVWYLPLGAFLVVFLLELAFRLGWFGRAQKR